MGQFLERPFSNKEVGRIQRKLDMDAQHGQPTQYDVMIDKLMIIDRTDDQEQFGTLTDYIDLGSTEEIEIRLYSGNSQHNDRYVLFFERNRPKPQEAVTLEGIQARISHAVTEQREKWETELLKKEHDKLKDDYKDLEEYADKLEEEVKTFRSKKLHLGNVNLVDLGGSLLEGMIRRNPQLLARLPGGEALAGAIVADNEDQPEAEPPAEQATFSRADSGSSQLSSQDRANLELLKEIQAGFTEELFLEVLRIIQMLMGDPVMIPQVIALLEGSTRQARTTTNEIQNIHHNQTEEFTDDL